MKLFANIYVLGLALIMMTASCANQEDSKLAAENEISAEYMNVTRIGQEEAVEAKFQGQAVTIETSDIISMRYKLNAENADAQAVMEINQALLGTEKEAQLLDVKFSMADEPIENGMFIFGIETENEKNLTLEMFDEEGYAMVANNKFDVNEGNNYKALNVNTLENGTYNFRLKDDAGRELNRQVTVATK